MQVIQTYKYKLRLNKKQIQVANAWIGTCRFIYNLALETKINAWQSAEINLSKYDLMKQLVDLKEYDWIASVPSQSLQNVIERLDSAYQKFFSGGGFPTWAKRQEYNSILFKSVEVTKSGGFKLPKLGEVRVCKDRLPEGKLKTATIIREIDGYYLCMTFAIESENVVPVSENQAVGIDMGVAYFLIDSNETFIENPRHTLKYEKQLRIANRSLARKQKKVEIVVQTKGTISEIAPKNSTSSTRFLAQTKHPICKKQQFDSL